MRNWHLAGRATPRHLGSNESKLVQPPDASSASPFEQVDFGLQVREPSKLNVKLPSICYHSLTNLANARLHSVNDGAQSLVFSTFSGERFFQFRDCWHLGHVLDSSILRSGLHALAVSSSSFWN
jgi:hypothetical protein